MKKYRVTIPYIYEMNVEAENEKEAIEKAIEEGGQIICRDDCGIEVEEERCEEK